MNIIIGIIGAIIFGSLFEDWTGIPTGFMLGFLLGMVLKLRKRVAKLEKQLGASPIQDSAQPLPEEASEDTATEPCVSDEIAEEPHESPVEIKEKVIIPPASSPEPAPAKKSGPPPIPPSSPSDGDHILEYLAAFFTRGNMVVRVGVIVLFFGVAFLLKYAVDNNMFPIELRLIAAALGGLTMLVIGWRLRLGRPGYALVMQGGGIGILYLTLFAAAKIYDLVPLGFAFAVMTALVVLSGILAVLQDAKSLAFFGTIGGFLAPILLSTGRGDHVMLFSYYAFLNAGILGIAWFKAWRILNLVGFVFTFTIGSAWGHQYYTPAYFNSTEPFLILFFLFYAAIAVLFAFRQPPHLKGYVDGTLVFGVPLAAFALQSFMVHKYEYGMAFTSLAMGFFYMGLASALWRRKPENMRMLTESFLAMGVVFGSLTVPLALDGRWITGVWAMEGAAMVWIGVRQSRCLARVFGLLLQLGAGIAFFVTLDDPAGNTPILNGIYLGCAMISFAGLFSSYYLNRHADQIRTWEKHFHIPMLVWGLLWWFGAGLWEIQRHVPGEHQIYANLLFIALSVGVMGWIARKREWRVLEFPMTGLLPVMIIMAGDTFVTITYPHPFVRWGWIAWAVAFGVQYHLLWHFEDRTDEAATFRFPKHVVHLWHWVTFWLLVFLLTWEITWVTGQISGKAKIWEFMVCGIFMGGIILAMLSLGERIRWPVRRFLTEYVGMGLMPLFVCLWIWEISAFSRVGNFPSLPYLPFVNPLDIAQGFVFLVIIRWVWQIRKQEQIQIPIFSDLPAGMVPYALAITIFIWLNAVLARTVHFWGGVPFTWPALYSSVVFQTAVSVLWTVIALGVMVSATRRDSRNVWIAGAILLGVVVAKLFLIDLSDIGNVARIVSFLGVGILMLVIGYFSPLPPRHEDDV